MRQKRVCTTHWGKWCAFLHEFDLCMNYLRLSQQERELNMHTWYVGSWSKSFLTVVWQGFWVGCKCCQVDVTDSKCLIHQGCTIPPSIAQGTPPPPLVGTYCLTNLFVRTLLRESELGDWYASLDAEALTRLVVLPSRVGAIEGSRENEC